MACTREARAGVFEALPRHCALVATEVQGAYRLEARVHETWSKGKAGTLKPCRLRAGVRKWTAVGRYASPYWFAPAMGGAEALAAVPPETHMLLVKFRDGMHACILAGVDASRGGVRTSIAGKGTPSCLDWARFVCGHHFPLSFRWHAGSSDVERGAEVTVAAVAVGSNPLVLPALAARALGLCPPPRKHERPAFARALGWCTWDAFYHEVSAEKVRAALAHFHRNGVIPGFVILDDGWADTGGSYGPPGTPPDREAPKTLRSLGANAKFPAGLRSLVDDLKRGFGVRHVGAWHTSTGYWGGLHGSLARELSSDLTQATVCVATWEKPRTSVSVALPATLDATIAFFERYHAALASAGITFVKVDAQNVLEMVSDKLGCGRFEHVSRMHTALAVSSRVLDAASRVPPVLHCMSQSNGTAQAVACVGGGIMRNSDDYVPSLPSNVQCLHVFANAMNALCTSCFALPDWDMFQTHGADGRACRMHGLARALSGGPVYVSDEQGKTDFGLLRELAVASDRVLQPDRPALPTRDCVFEDVAGTCTRAAPPAPRWVRVASASAAAAEKEAKEDADAAGTAPLKVSNRCGRLGVVGAFHVAHGRTADVEGVHRPEDVHDLDLEGVDRVAAYSRASHAVWVARKRGSSFEGRAFRLAAVGCDVVSYAPMRAGERAAPFGLVEKFCGAAAVVRWERRPGDHAYVCDVLRDALSADAVTTRCAFYCASKPAKVECENADVTWEWRAPDGLLLVRACCTAFSTCLRVTITMEPE